MSAPPTEYPCDLCSLSGLCADCGSDTRVAYADGRWAHPGCIGLASHERPQLRRVARRLTAHAHTTQPGSEDWLTEGKHHV